MLFTPLTTLFFLVPLSTALDQFRHGVILEYADASGLTKRDNIVDHVARSLPGVKLKHRMDLSSDRIFHGASFRVTETAGHVDDNLLRRALTQYRDVITVYPLDVVQLQVQPTFDDSRGAAVRPRDVAQGAGAEADHVARARVPDQTSTRTRARKHRPREDAGLTDSGAGTGNSSASGLYVNYGTEGSPLVNPHASTGVDRLHAEQLTGRGVRIALLDSGIDAFHPALGGGYGPGFKVYGGADLTGESLDDPNSSVYTPGSSPLTQCENHGTGTASVAAGLPYHFGFVGVAPNASIEMYKVMKCRATTVHSDVGVKASIMAFDSGVDVISMSIGGPGGWSNSKDGFTSSPGAWATPCRLRLCTNRLLRRRRLGHSPRTHHRARNTCHRLGRQLRSQGSLDRQRHCWRLRHAQRGFGRGPVLAHAHRQRVV